MGSLALTAEGLARERIEEAGGQVEGSRGEALSKSHISASDPTPMNPKGAAEKTSYPSSCAMHVTMPPIPNYKLET